MLLPSHREQSGKAPESYRLNSSESGAAQVRMELALNRERNNMQWKHATVTACMLVSTFFSNAFRKNGTRNQKNGRLLACMRDGQTCCSGMVAGLRVAGWPRR